MKHYVNLLGETVDFSTYITWWDGRWYIARWVERGGQWVGPLRPAVRKASGCHSFFARTAEGIPGAGGHSYARRADAVRAVVRLYGMQEAR